MWWSFRRWNAWESSLLVYMIFQTYRKTQLLKVKKVKNPKNKHTKSYTKWSPNWTSEEVMSAFWPAIFCTNQAMLQIPKAWQKWVEFENFHKKRRLCETGGPFFGSKIRQFNLCFPPKQLSLSFLVPIFPTPPRCVDGLVDKFCFTWPANANSFKHQHLESTFLLAFSAPSVKWDFWDLFMKI